ncbi:DUF159 family protein [Burkholderia pyrrocinia]|uniref:DUF159 family protein n=1 Tax=Burkholderia pyrrocinia TaxID=60550 RepID=A0A2Z5MVM3_BURPY|nr:DUF159 family protein [Burkholderia pyrrocinia]
MCTNYKAPNDDPGINELKIGIGDLFRRDPWDVDVWPDYRAPAVLANGRGSVVVAGVYGFVPKFLQKDRIKQDGKKAPKASTYNARGEEVGEKSMYKKAWREGRRCLIPALWVVEPSYPNAHRNAKGVWVNGPCTWQRIGLTDWRPFCVPGIWQANETKDGTVIGISMLTLNGAEHAIWNRMHRPIDEKRGVAFLHPADYDEWLHTKNVDVARAMLQLYPADEMIAEPK